MVATNRDKLIKQSVIGEITSPLGGASPYLVDPDGRLSHLPGVGGITYNLAIGDPACGLAADHVEPGVSISNFTNFHGQPGPNRALNQYACVGNQAYVVSGEAKGERGRVTGKHGGIEHVLIDFPQETLEKLVIGDKIQVRAFGTGLTLSGHPQVTVMNLDPDVLEKMGVVEKKGTLQVPVTHRVPARIMGSGIGQPHSFSGDYDIQLFDRATVEEFGLDDLNIGDFVAIIDAEAAFGRVYRTGGMVIGVVVHSNCVLAGHGPGVMSILSAANGAIVPLIDSEANLRRVFDALAG